MTFNKLRVLVIPVAATYDQEPMDDVLTPRMLLGHMQGIKSDLQSQIDGLAKEMRAGFTEMRAGFAEMRRGFEEAREHRQALQEDLEATIQMQGKQKRQIARLQKQ